MFRENPVYRTSIHGAPGGAPLKKCHKYRKYVKNAIAAVCRNKPQKRILHTKKPLFTVFTCQYQGKNPFRLWCTTGAPFLWCYGALKKLLTTLIHINTGITRIYVTKSAPWWVKIGRFELWWVGPFGGAKPQLLHPGHLARCPFRIEGVSTRTFH